MAVIDRMQLYKKAQKMSKTESLETGGFVPIPWPRICTGSRMRRADRKL